MRPRNSVTGEVAVSAFPLARRWLGRADADITINAANGTFEMRLLVPVPELNCRGDDPDRGNGAGLKWQHERRLSGEGQDRAGLLRGPGPERRQDARGTAR